MSIFLMSHAPRNFHKNVAKELTRSSIMLQETVLKHWVRYNFVQWMSCCVYFCHICTVTVDSDVQYGENCISWFEDSLFKSSWPLVGQIGNMADVEVWYYANGFSFVFNQSDANKNVTTLVSISINYVSIDCGLRTALFLCCDVIMVSEKNPFISSMLIKCY